MPQRNYWTSLSGVDTVNTWHLFPSLLSHLLNSKEKEISEDKGMPRNCYSCSYLNSQKKKKTYLVNLSGETIITGSCAVLLDKIHVG